MDESKAIEYLMHFGMSRQEATVYLRLIEAGKQTGYEIARDTGISRSNVYASLAALVEKGAAYLVEEDAKRYIPVHVQEFCGNRIRRMEEEQKWLDCLLYTSPSPRDMRRSRGLGDVYKRQMEEEQKWLDMNLTGEQKEEEGYVTIDGQEHISDKIHNLLANVEERVYCSCSGVCLEQLKGQLKELTEKGKKVVLVTDHPFELSGAIIYVTKEKGNQIGLITDSKYVLSGEYGQESRNTCVYSGQRNFVTLFKTALANEIELIKIREGENENE